MWIRSFRIFLRFHRLFVAATKQGMVFEVVDEVIAILWFGKMSGKVRNVNNGLPGIWFAVRLKKSRRRRKSSWKNGRFHYLKFASSLNVEEIWINNEQQWTKAWIHTVGKTETANTARKQHRAHLSTPFFINHCEGTQNWNQDLGTRARECCWTKYIAR